MKNRIFKSGEKVYDDVVVPNGVEICETYDETKMSMRIEWSIKGIKKVPIIISVNPMDLEQWNPTEEELRKIIVSGFIDYARRRANW